MSVDYHRRTTCRGCGHKHLTQVMDFGEMPLANAFITPDQVDGETRYPLTLAFCPECSLLQVPDVVDPAVLFGNYVYATGSSAPLVTHFYNYAHDAILPLVSENDLVVDIGGNDGTLTKFLCDRCRTINVDPSATAQYGMVLSESFSSAVAKGLVDISGPAKVVTANNVLAHVDDVFDFVRGVRHLLADDGTFIFEVHWVKDLIDRTGYDQVYHEHLCYFSLRAVMRLLNNAGLYVNNVQVVQMHGQCLRIFATKTHLAYSRHVEAIIKTEENSGLGSVDTYLTFATRAQNHRELLRDLVYDLVDGGARMIGYGAPAKGTTLLNYCGIGEDLDYVVDGSPAKRGKLVPGVHVDIVSPDELMDDSPNYALLLSWNYADHILAKEKDLRARGTKFIVPFPEIRIV